MLSKFPKLEIISSFGVGYDHIDFNYARDHKIVVTHTPDVLTEETADAALGLLICTVREFVKADRYVRSGLWANQPYPLTAGSMRDRTVGMVGMGRIGRAIARRLEAMKVPVVYHARRPAENVLYRHYPKLLDMAKAVDTLVVMTPGGAATSKLVNAEVINALGPNGVIVNMSRGSVVDEEALIAALKKRRDPGRRPRRVRQRAGGARRAARDAECRAAAAHRLGFGADARRDGPARGREHQGLVCRQDAADADSRNAGEGPLTMQSREAACACGRRRGAARRG